MKGLEGVSDSDFHGGLCPETVLMLRRAAAQASRTSPSVGHGIYICGGEKTEQTLPTFIFWQR